MINKILLTILCMNVFTAYAIPEAEIASRIWILTHTKPCPQCAVRIEKNGGCDYILCAHCTYEFCWECAQPHNHQTHTCTHQQQ